MIEVHVRRAEPWRRAAAWGVDGVPFLAGGVALSRALVREATVGVPGPVTGLDLLDFVARERVIVLSVAAAVVLALGVYATLAHALAGATFGKRLLHLRVVGPDGGRPSLARSAARSALAFASIAALGLGFLLALFTPSGRGLHDLVARTWVVDAQP
ncbi:MAG TPA: RDD family protein [Anaeromyxobacter sp.]|nr:RDD family protein [Anaeromyxobacter sp.]